ncbi:MAG: hypothetical protein K6F34_02690 [Lachnospiraceae bacterium]|nr:hypothetical protein [Lachnospiraceae bacterium]
MIDSNTILSFGYYKKGKPFTGSHEGIRYRIVMEKGKDKDDTDKFRVDTWPEPLCFEATDPSLITTQYFSFGEGGYGDVIAYLNDILTQR